MRERRKIKRTIRHHVPPQGVSAAPVVDDANNSIPRSPVITDHPLMSEEECRFVMQMLRAAPDGLLSWIVQSLPTETLIQIINETPIQGRLQVLPQRLNKLISLQEKLVGSLKKTE